jgi:hypothetical protein
MRGKVRIKAMFREMGERGEGEPQVPPPAPKFKKSDVIFVFFCLIFYGFFANLGLYLVISGGNFWEGISYITLGAFLFVLTALKLSKMEKKFWPGK